MLRSFIILLSLLFTAPLFAIRLPLGDSALMAKHIDSIDRAYPHINYAGQWSVSFYTALSSYPELRNTTILFRYKNINTTMQCRPKTFSVLRRPEKRTFLMVFNRNRGRSRGVPLADLSYKARIGLFAHEIAHVVDYLHRGSANIALLGLKYISRKGKITLEHRIDRMVIWKNLGNYVLTYAKEVLANEGITQDYRRKRTQIYLRPKEIKQLIRIVENIPADVNR